MRSVSAVENNIYGIHLAQPHFEDIDKAGALVNSNGGDWGYITLVIQENDRHVNKWQEIFDILREKHLIPIIRIATQPDGNNWKRPEKEQFEDWANFLNSLNWVVKERYVILFNEPNHATEWGGVVDAADYRDRVMELAQKIKAKNTDFFLMLAGLDASAPSSLPNYEDEYIFLENFFDKETIQQYNNLFSGWTSHSYPNPGFSGSPNGYGRGSIRTYQWELEVLKELGVNKNLPIFITETGWRRQTETDTAENFRIAFQYVWQEDSRVKAVTPFILNYQAEPFLSFSWKKYNDDGYYQQYYTVQNINKIKGEPVRAENGVISFDKPKELVTSSSYNFKLKLKNTGQAIWDKDEGYALRLDGYPQNKYFFSDLKMIKPFEETEINLYFKVNGTLGKEVTKIALYKNDKKILEDKEWVFNILPLPNLEFNVAAFPKLLTNGEDFEIQIFDSDRNLIFKKSGLKVKNNQGYLENIQNIILGKQYRIVILRPYYLPRQAFITFKIKGNLVKFEKMLALDFNVDGKFGLEDLISLTKNWRLLKMFIP